MNIVFTGPAIDGNGNSILRASLSYACIQKGNLMIQSSIRKDTDILVASRVDTVKAAKASQAGIAVFSYPEFINRFLRGVTIATSGVANKYVDHVSADLLAALIHNPDISCVLNIEYLVIYSDFVSFSTRPSSSRVAPEFD